jgi:hypothetical protein
MSSRFSYISTERLKELERLECLAEAIVTDPLAYPYNRDDRCIYCGFYNYMAIPHDMFCPWALLETYFKKKVNKNV